MGLMGKQRPSDLVPHGGFGLLLAWTTCSFRTNFLFHAADGIGINSNTIWLFSIGSCCVALLAYPLYRRWLQAWAGRGGFRLFGLLSGAATILFPFASPKASLSWVIVPLIGIGSGLLYALLLSGWIRALSRLDHETVEVVLPSNMAVTPVCLIVFSLLPEPATIILIASLPLASSYLLTHLLRDLDHQSYGVTHWRQFASWRSGSRITKSAVCFAVVFFASATIETLVPGTVLASASWGERLAFQTPTMMSGLFAVVISFIVIEFSIRIDLPCIYRWAAPLLLAGLALEAAGYGGLWSLVLVKMAYDAFFLLGMVMIIEAESAAENRQLAAIGFIALSQAAFIAGSEVAAIGLCSEWFSPAVSALGSLLLFCLTFYFIPPSLSKKHEITAQSFQEFEERRSLEEALDIVARQYQLTVREREVASYLVRGRSRPYIQEAMHLSKNTVATHAKNLYMKTNVHSKQELIDLVEQSQMDDNQRSEFGEAHQRASR